MKLWTFVPSWGQDAMFEAECLWDRLVNKNEVHEIIIYCTAML